MKFIFEGIHIFPFLSPFERKEWFDEISKVAGGDWLATRVFIGPYLIGNIDLAVCRNKFKALT